MDCQDQLPEEIKKESLSQPHEVIKVDCQEQSYKEIKNECQLQHHHVECLQTCGARNISIHL